MNTSRSRSPARSALLALCVAALGSVAVAQARDERTAAVGMRAVVEQLVLPGSELVAATSTLKSPIVVRVLKVWPHGTQFRYDLEWTGLVAGTFDLASFLARKDGSPATDLPKIEVVVTGVLGKDLVEPSELTPKSTERLGGYSTTQKVFWVLWGIGLVLILFVGRRFRRQKRAVVVVPTLADRLRPLVEAVATGASDTAAQAELERLLVAFWRSRLGLADQKAGDAIVAIRQHPEAGVLLRQLEAWLHMPKPELPKQVDWANLLQPYRAVTAKSFEPIVPPEAG